jgi:hypothetical protein
MARDLLLGRRTTWNWGLGLKNQPPHAATYSPATWWSEDEVEGELRRVKASGGLFGTPLPRAAAERKTLEHLRDQNIGISSGTMGSWLLSAKDQKRIFDKIDDVRYDVRLASRRVGIGLGCLAGALGLLGVASIYKTSYQQNPKR